MRYIIAVCAALLCVGCSDHTADTGWPDSSVDVEAGTTLELVCAYNFCGNIVDTNTGATADCGSCQGYAQCGDNGVANICGSVCMPLVSSDGDGGTYPLTPACNYQLGLDWWVGYASGVQFPSACNYMDPNACILINNPWPPNRVCGGTVCGSWYCCVDDVEAGLNPLLPGYIANNDAGGLP